MTPHDRAREIRASKVLNNPGPTSEEVMDAIGGIQSTDDPSLVAYEDELWKLYRKLKKKEKQK